MGQRGSAGPPFPQGVAVRDHSFWALPSVVQGSLAGLGGVVGLAGVVANQCSLRR